MKLCKLMKDGGPLSRVWGFYLIEIKRLFSVVFLMFADGSREAYHTHAFNAVSWVLRGKLVEYQRNGLWKVFKPSLLPIYTSRDNFHKVNSVGTTWAITFRGPWVDKWREYIPATAENLTLTHGRKVINGKTVS